MMMNAEMASEIIRSRTQTEKTGIRDVAGGRSGAGASDCRFGSTPKGSSMISHYKFRLRVPRKRLGARAVELCFRVQYPLIFSIGVGLMIKRGFMLAAIFLITAVCSAPWAISQQAEGG